MALRGQGYIRDSSDSDNTVYDDPYNVYQSRPLSLMAHPGLKKGNLGVQGKNYMVLHAKPNDVTDAALSSSTMTDNNGNLMGREGRGQLGASREEINCTSLLNSIGDPENFLQLGSAYLLQCVNTSQRFFWFIVVMVASFFFYPLTSTLVFAAFSMVLVGGHKNEDGKQTSRTVKWTVTAFSQQLKDGFLTSPAFLENCGQWRLVIKQKKGMDGPQTSFGLLCTDIFPEVEAVTTSTSFFCTNQLGQEVNTGGMRTLKYDYEFLRPGDCGCSRPVRISRRQLGDSEVMIVHCSIEFRKKTASLLRAITRNFRNDRSAEGEERNNFKKGKNVVSEHGAVFPGDLEFHEEGSLPSAFRPVLRFVQHEATRTFVWEIPAFTSLLESSELWGVYSPQFFVNCQDVCSIWRMKLLEVQGVFRLHVQLRGLPNCMNQVKLWYLLQLVDNFGDSVIPEHATSRVKYPDHLSLWDTTRHILYKRETILERFINENGSITIRISLQMQPNDVSLMEVDSDEWINCPNMGSAGMIQQGSATEHPTSGLPMISN